MIDTKQLMSDAEAVRASKSSEAAYYARSLYVDALLLMLLDEIERLNHALSLAYPRALRAAAALVTAASESKSIIEGAPDVRRWIEDLADDILALSAGQIEAFGKEIDRDHAAAVEPKRESEDAREWCWRVDGSEVCQGPFATREEAIHHARHDWDETGPIEVGRCTLAMDAIGTPDADHMRELVNDILSYDGLDAHAIILDEPAADAALHAWFMRYVDVDGMQWIARDEETVWPDEPGEGSEV